MLARVARAQGQLIQGWDVLSTMTPHDYSTIRPHLGSSSGFQSWQYRMMEFMLGGRNPDMIALHDRAPEVARSLREEAARPSLYDEAIRLLARRGFAIDPAVTERDPKEPYAHSSSVEAAWADIYRAPNRSEEHTSELQSLMRISYAVFCLKKQKSHYTITS